MLQKLYDFARQLLTISRDVQESKADTAALQEEVADIRRELRNLAEAVREIKSDLAHDREVQRLEHEKLILTLQNELLRFERRLGPGSTTENRD